MSQNTHLHCACGQVQLEVERTPIMSVECYCNSCRQAGARLHELSPDHLIVSENGGTRFVLYRKDRVRLVSGADHLKEFRLTADSPTRRVIARAATCRCSSNSRTAIGSAFTAICGLRARCRRYSCGP